MRTERFVYFCIKNYIRTQPRVMFVSERPLNLPVVYTTDCSKTVVPMLFLSCVALVYNTRLFMFGLALFFVYVFLLSF